MVGRVRPRFALLGAAGHVAPRHLRAIKDVGGELIAACDHHDSVGVLDRYFPEAEFFTDLEQLDQFLRSQKRMGQGVEYVSICTPNVLHAQHVETALSWGAHAICEKPLALDPADVARLRASAERRNRRIYPILQLRYHESIRNMHLAYRSCAAKTHAELTWVAPRGPWYEKSWKGDPGQSGGLAMNIGIHLFDVLLWIFGAVSQVQLHESTDKTCVGQICCERATIRFLLSIDGRRFPPLSGEFGRPQRCLTVDGRSYDFSEGMTELHTTVYQEILTGRAPQSVDAVAAVDLVHRLSSEPALVRPESPVPSPLSGRIQDADAGVWELRSQNDGTGVVP